MNTSKIMNDAELAIDNGRALQSMLEKERVMESIEFLTRSITPIPLDSVVIVRTRNSLFGYGRAYQTLNTVDTGSDRWSSKEELNENIDVNYIEWALLEDINNEPSQG